MEEDKKDNRGGRQPGSQNKVTREVKELISDVLQKEFKDIESRLKSLAPKDRIELTIKLLPYVVPRQQDIKLEEEQIITIVVDSKDRQLGS